MKTIFILIICSVMTTHATAQHQRTEHWYDRYEQFKTENDSTMKSGTIFLGNSITEGFDLDVYFPGKQLINRGISGDHIDGLTERLDVSVIQLKPVRLFMLIGINDIGAGDTDSTIMGNFDLLFSELSHLADTRIYIQSILPTRPEWTNCPPEQILLLNNWLEQRTIDHRFEWINLYPYFTDDAGYLRTELTSDGLHLNANGYEQWAAVLKPVVMD